MQKMAVATVVERGFKPEKCREIVNNSYHVLGCPLEACTAFNVQKKYKTTALNPENGCSCSSGAQN